MRNEKLRSRFYAAAFLQYIVRKGNPEIKQTSVIYFFSALPGINFFDITTIYSLPFADCIKKVTKKNLRDLNFSFLIILYA